MTMYSTVEAATTYFETRLHSGLWGETSMTDKIAAMTTATRHIDRLSFVGCKTESDQELQFPRGGDLSVPSDINIACYELAYSLLDGRDPEMELEALAVVSEGFASVRETFDRSQVQEHLNAGIVSHLAWKYLRPYLRDDHSIKISRV